MLEHIAYLSQTIGARGSCTSKEKEACQYTQAVMQALGLSAVNLESFQANQSTYLPFALAFGAALVGSLAALFIPAQTVFIVATALNALGAAGMLAETNLSTNWMQWLLPKAASHNSVGVFKPQGDIKKQVVLCAHVDTHRTPIFYSSESWHKVFSLLVQLAFASMVLCAILFILLAFTLWDSLRWLAVLIALVATQRGLIALTICTLPEPSSQESSHWHQMSDTVEHVDPTCLENVFQFTLVLLKTFDQPGYRHR